MARYCHHLFAGQKCHYRFSGTRGRRERVPEESNGMNMYEKKLAVVALCSAALFGCATQGPTGPEKAAAYHAEEARLAEEAKNPPPPTEEETTLQFPMCDSERRPLFPKETDGAAFRAILYFKITDDGKTKDHCYMRVEGAIKWEERAVFDVDQWAYPVEFAGQPRERIVTYRLK